MTAKNIKGKSLEGDTYETPLWVVEECIDKAIPNLTFAGKHPLILEPGAGAGNILRVLKERMLRSHVHAFELRTEVKWPKIQCAVKGYDFLKHQNAEQDAQRWMQRAKAGIKYDLALGNPPFTHAQEWVERLRLMAHYVVLLLRQGFLSSAKREKFWREYQPSDVFILSDRPKFLAGSQGDTSDYCWALWPDYQPRQTRLHWMPTVPLERRKKG